MNIFGLLAAIQIIEAMNTYINKESLHCEFLNDFYLLKLFLELLKRAKRLENGTKPGFIIKIFIVEKYLTRYFKTLYNKHHIIWGSIFP